MADQKIQGNLRVNGNLKLPSVVADKAMTVDGSGNLVSSSVTTTELSRLSGVTGDIQTQIDGKAASVHSHAISDVSGLQTALDAKIASSEKGAANGVATLGADQKLTASQIPAMAITDTFVVANEAAMLALVAQVGDVAIRSDEAKTYILQGSDPSVLGNWVYLQTPASPVLSVNGQTGVVSLDTTVVPEGTNLYFTDSRAKAAAVNDSIADGILDVAPSQNAVFDALALKANTSHTHVIADVTGLQTALDSKADLLSPAFSGAPTSTTPAAADNSTKIATTAFVQSEIASQAPNLSLYLKRDGTSDLTGNLVPDANNTRSLGSASLNFSNIYTAAISSALGLTLSTPNALTGFGSAQIVIQTGTTDDVSSAGLDLATGASQSGDSGFVTIGSGSSQTGSSGGVGLTTGAVALGTGNSGNISLTTGASAGGTRGQIVLDGSAINASSKKIINLADPTLAQDAATKSYVDTAVAGATPAGVVLADGTIPMTGNLDLGGNSITNSYAVSASLITDSSTIGAIAVDTRYLVNSSGTSALGFGTTGQISVESNKITNLSAPTVGTDAATKNYVDGQINTVKSANDIAETSFSTANNQATPANVTGLLMASGARSAKVLLSVYINATSSLYEAFELLIIKKGSSYDMSVVSVGDDSGIILTITSAGQVQYTSTNVAGFTAGTMKFRAITTTV